MKLAERTFKRNDYKLTSPFGMRTHPVTHVQKLHSGADYGTQGQKWKQYALENGTVLNAGVDTQGYNALFAWVKYPRLGIKVLYYHLDQVFVKKGQKVTHDTIIGHTGTSGLSTGIHLHMGVKRLTDDTYFDPETFDYVPEVVNIVQEETKPIEVVSEVKVGDKVWIKQSATKYSTGAVIPVAYKKNGARHTKPYTIVGDGDKSTNKLVHGYWKIGEIVSFVKKSEVEKA